MPVFRRAVRPPRLGELRFRARATFVGLREGFARPGAFISYPQVCSIDKYGICNTASAIAANFSLNAVVRQRESTGKPADDKALNADRRYVRLDPDGELHRIVRDQLIVREPGLEWRPRSAPMRRIAIAIGGEMSGLVRIRGWTAQLRLPYCADSRHRGFRSLKP